MKFAHELCCQTTKQCQSHNIVLVSLQTMFNITSSQPKNIKFGWEFTKLYQFNVKQMKMCSLFLATLYDVGKQWESECVCKGLNIGYFGDDSCTPDNSSNSVKALKEASWTTRSGFNPTVTTPPCTMNRHRLLKHKRLPILLHALEVCNSDRQTMQSLGFTLGRFFVKLFITPNLEMVRPYQTVLWIAQCAVVEAIRYIYWKSANW